MSRVLIEALISLIDLTSLHLYSPLALNPPHLSNRFFFALKSQLLTAVPAL